jgi:hypothetical protein
MAGSTSNTVQRKRQRVTPAMSLISASDIFTYQAVAKQKIMVLVCLRSSGAACQGTTRQSQVSVQFVQTADIIRLEPDTVKQILASIVCLSTHTYTLSFVSRHSDIGRLLKT